MTFGNLTALCFQEGAVTQSRSGPTPATTMRATDEHMERLRPLYDNIITKTYCFPTNLGHNLSVHEFLGESRLCYSLPRQLLWVDVYSLAPGICGRNLELVIFKLISRMIYFLHLVLNCPQVNATWPHRWLCNISSGNGLVPSDNKSLPEPMLTQI